jgi:Putative F0F1-ATPase subunit Ca2+/Mg2+ transporter
MNRKFAIAMALGFECVGLVTACLFIGQYLDHHYGWKGTATALGAVVGVIGWFTHMVVVLRQLSKSETPTDPRHKDEP